MDMSCIFYDYKLCKIVPCNLIPNYFPARVNRSEPSERQYIVKVSFDPTKYSQYNVNHNELLRYSSEYVDIFDLYPATNQTEIDYAISCFPNIIPNNSTYCSDELKRFEKLIKMFVSTDTIDKDIFYMLADFTSYELLFRYNTHEEKQFMMYISNYIITEVPAQIQCAEMIRTVWYIKEKYPNTLTDDTYYRIYNYRNISEFNIYTYPILLDIQKFYTNIDFLIPYIT